MYKLRYDDLGYCDAVIRLADNAVIPLDPRNRDFQIFLVWNASADKPLDLKSTIAPLPQAVDPYQVLAQRVTALEGKVTTLEAARVR
jgi:hypothetical protein